MCQFNRVITSTTIVSVLHFNIILHSAPLFLKFFSFLPRKHLSRVLYVRLRYKISVDKTKIFDVPALEAISEPIIGLLSSVSSAKISSRWIVSYIFISSASLFSAVSYLCKQFSSKTLRAVWSLFFLTKVPLQLAAACQPCNRHGACSCVPKITNSHVSG
jgi:hypothetical protein